VEACAKGWGLGHAEGYESGLTVLAGVRAGVRFVLKVRAWGSVLLRLVLEVCHGGGLLLTIAQE
jgi:hypothetical protein